MTEINGLLYAQRPLKQEKCIRKASWKECLMLCSSVNGMCLGEEFLDSKDGPGKRGEG